MTLFLFLLILQFVCLHLEKEKKFKVTKYQVAERKNGRQARNVWSDYWSYCYLLWLWCEVLSELENKKVPCWNFPIARERLYGTAAQAYMSGLKRMITEEGLHTARRNNPLVRNLIFRYGHPSISWLYSETPHKGLRCGGIYNLVFCFSDLSSHLWNQLPWGPIYSIVTKYVMAVIFILY